MTPLLDYSRFISICHKLIGKNKPGLSEDALIKWMFLKIELSGHITGKVKSEIHSPANFLLMVQDKEVIKVSLQLS